MAEWIDIRSMTGRFVRNRRRLVFRISMFIALAIAAAGGTAICQSKAGVHSRLDAQQRQIESLRTAVRTQGTTIQYLSQSDSAGLTSNPFVQRQIRAQVEASNGAFIERTYGWIVVLAAVVIALIVLLVLTRYSMMKRVRELERRLCILQSAVDEDALLRESHIIAQREAELLGMGEGLSGTGGLPGDPFNPFAGHGLALRVADEIHRMRKRISYMDEETTGLSALKHSLKRLEQELNSGGYEIVDLAGKKYVDGLNVEARFVPADSGDIAEETITDTLRPQVNYMGVMIQPAKVEVSKSYL